MREEDTRDEYEREGPLWTCPMCGAKFLTKNMWHSCGEATMEDRWLAWDPDLERDDRAEQMVAACTTLLRQDAHRVPYRTP